MTLEEQFKKERNFFTPYELSIKDFDAYALRFQYAFNAWLKEKLTWKKFSEQKPKVGTTILVRRAGYDIVINECVQQYLIELYETEYPESEWMYVPE